MEEGERWKKIKCIRYRKTTTFYDPTGVIEKKNVQQITHQWRPKKTEMIWENEGKPYRALKDPTGISLYKEGILQKDSLLLAQANTNLKAALYVYWQPFNLLENKAQRNYPGNPKNIGFHFCTCGTNSLLGGKKCRRLDLFF